MMSLSTIALLIGLLAVVGLRGLILAKRDQ